MNVFLIEDEELAVRKLSKLLLDADPTIRIVGTAASVRSAVAWLNANGPGQPSAPDLILMDIELADGQSFEIFEQTTVSAPVIFTTSYDEYALRAFKVNSIDYLLKPIKRHELEASLVKYKRTVADNGEPAEPKPGDIGPMDIDALVQQLRQQIQPTEHRRRFLVKHYQQWVPVEVGDIAYFYEEEGTSRFRTHGNQQYTLDYPIDELENMLDPAQFFRVNRQYIVQTNTIQQVHPYFDNQLKLTLRPAASSDVLVSRERAADFKKWLGK